MRTAWHWFIFDSPSQQLKDFSLTLTFMCILCLRPYDWNKSCHLLSLPERLLLSLCSNSDLTPSLTPIDSHNVTPLMLATKCTDSCSSSDEMTLLIDGLQSHLTWPQGRLNKTYKWVNNGILTQCEVVSQWPIKVKLLGNRTTNGKLVWAKTSTRAALAWSWSSTAS